MTKQAESAIDQAAQDAKERQGITEWIEKNIGGKVTDIDRQRRWRPVWRVSLDLDGQTKELLVKGVRAWNCTPYSLLHEMKVMQMLEANGINIPHTYGMCDYPEAFVMDWIEGGRDPGLVAEAIESSSTMSPDRWQASLKYMDILAQMHKINPADVAAIGVKPPQNPEEVALNHINAFHQMYLDAKLNDPYMEFCMKWLQRNVPQHRTQASFVTGDSGQFLNDGPNITTILDVEVGHLGDCFHDLACFRGRHPVENMGDVPALFRRYAESKGEPLDIPVIAYHTVVFLTCAYFGPLFALAELTPGGDWVESALQVFFIGRRNADAMAEIIGVELDDFELPEPHITPMEDMALGKLIYEVNRLPTSKTFAEWQRNTISAIPQYLLNQAHFGRWAEDEDLNDAEQLIGQRPANLKDADRLLTEFVHKAGPEYDAPLLKLFHRRLLRQCLIFAGPGASKDHLLFAKVEPILDQAF